LTKKAFVVLSAITIVMAVFWLGYAIRFREITDLTPMCAPLLERGVHAQVCSGAMLWLVTGEVNHAAELLQRLTIATLVEVTLIALLSLVPLWMARNVFAENRMVLFIVVVCFLPMLPLYATATDWSRWLSLSYTAAILLLIQAHAAQQLTITGLPKQGFILGYVCVALLIAPEHSLGLKLGGAANEVVQHILIFLS
jgi:hypothetical protein